MNEIGNNFKQARLSSSISLKEASVDTNIKIESLEQMEEGSIGSFKDIFKLKEYLQTYAKYLGLDPEEIIDNFNEFMFEYTSKIPLDTIGKEIEEREKEKNLEDTGDIKIVSPYLKPEEEKQGIKYIVIAVSIIILASIALIWAIKQVV